MRVKEICTRRVRSCNPDTTLADAGWSMWEGDFGVLPVVDAQGKVVGVVTDRDICMGVVTKGKPAREILVGEVISDKLFSCRLNDDVRNALRTMRSQKVRRLPVLDPQGKLQGILSLNDVALVARADEATPEDITYEDLALAHKAICERRFGAREPLRVPSVLPEGT